jgi:hypothetical protein
VRGGWPLLRRASGRMLRSGSVAAMIVISVALLAGLVAAGPLFGRATASGSLERKLATVGANSQVVQQAALGVTAQGRIPATAQTTITKMVDETPWLGTPVTSQWGAAWQLSADQPTPFLASGTKRREGVLWYRSGAIGALNVVQGERGAKGVWIPESMAENLGLKPGDRFRAGTTIEGGDIQGCGQNGTVGTSLLGEPPTSQGPVTLAGTYRTRPDGRTPVGQYFSDIASQLPSDPLACPTPALLIIGDQATIAAALAKANEVPIWTHSAALTPAGRTPDRLKQAAEAAEQLKLAGADPGSDLSKLLAEGGAVGRVDTALPQLQSDAEADARTADQQGRGIGYAGGALGLAAVVVALRSLAQRRRQETELLVGLGTPMPVVVGAGALELLLPALLGSALGGVAAGLAFDWFGPQRTLGPGAVRATVLAAGLVAVLTLVCGALVILLQARSIGRDLSGTATAGGSGPWLPLLTGATAIAVGATLARDSGGSYTDPLSAVLPILILACGSLLLVRLIGLIAGARSRRRANRPPAPTAPRSPARLVVRGLRNTGTAVADLVVILAIGIGVLAYGLVSAASVHGSAEDKASVLAGASSVAHIPHSYNLGGGQGPAPKLGSGKAIVWRATGQLRPDYLGVDLLVVNPDTLRSTASWGVGPELAKAKAALKTFDSDQSTVKGTVPALLVGLPARAVGSGATVLIGADELTLTARGNLEAFPGVTHPTVVLDARSLFPTLDARNKNLDPSLKSITEGQGDYATWLWSMASPTALAGYLDQHNVAASATTSLEAAKATPVLTSSSWAATYQIVLGAAAAALAGLSVIVAVDRRVARAAPVDLVLRRFGVRSGRLIGLRAGELALTCLGALAVLAAPFALVLLLLPRLVEPGPDLAPAMGVRVPLVPLLLSALAAVAVTGVAVLVAARRSATLKPAEVLRDDQ